MSSEIGLERCKDWGATSLGGVFSVEWIRKESLPFQVTHQVLNPWNENKKVQISRDGQVGTIRTESATRCRVVFLFCFVFSPPLLLLKKMVL